MKPSPNSPQNMTFGQKLRMGLIVGFGVLVISFSFYGYQLFFTGNILVSQQDQESAYVLVPKNADFDAVVDSLRGRVIHEEISFRFVSKLLSYDENIKPGVYKLTKGMNNLEAVRKLRAGNQEPVSMTFNNARTKAELAPKICKGISAKPDELLEMLRDPKVTGEYGFDTLTVEAMFIPNTYEVYWTLDAAGVMKRMHEEYEKFWTEKRRQQAETIGLTPLKVSVLASIVDAETTKKDEKGRVAGVYMNRLNKGMMLQADPTLVFAHGDFSIKRVYDKHKEIDSPYNTYKFTGLPPGPIRIPSVSALDAVLNYEKHSFIFFCAKEDFSGYHVFAETNAEHERNARKYRAALNENGIR